MNGKDNSGSSPAIECQPTGIYSIPDPTECNSYYQCDKGTRTKLGCPERKLFDTEKRECNDHERVTCGARAINLSDKNQFILSILTDSSESNLRWNIQKQKRTSTNSNDNIFHYQSTFSTSLQNTTIVAQYLITKPNSYLYNPDEDEDILSERMKRDAAPFVCKTDGYFPDRQNCRIYHICTSGVDTASVCGEGTAWDPAKKNCNWENTVECKKGLRKWDQITDIRGVTLFATDPANAWRMKKKTTTTRQPIKVDSNFTCEYDAEGYFPDTKYCHIYHFCGIGAHTVLQCSENLWFSTETQGCEWPEKSDCKAASLPPSSTAATNTRDGDGNPITTPRHSPPSNVYLPIDCPKNVQGHFPDPYDCSVFHYCN
ncbi:unnamed protein product, partial [Rotaria magnacalcarata]